MIQKNNDIFINDDLIQIPSLLLQRQKIIYTYQVNFKTCYQTKKLVYEIFKLAADTKGFPYNDPELMKRAHEQKLNEHQMRPYNELAIKLMRRFRQLNE